MTVDQTEIKKLVGEKAASYVEEGMLVGLGTGSTATFFIEALAKRNLKITAVSSSIRSSELATSLGMQVIDMQDVTSIDLTVDGADEVDSQKRLIKGGGGAHVREKIVATTSKKLIIIIDESKLVPRLGACALPVEILQFGYNATIAKLNKLGFKGALRVKEGKQYITDNGNFIYDVKPNGFFENPEKVHLDIIKTPGVIDTGFFFNLDPTLLIGYKDGRIEIR